MHHLSCIHLKPALDYSILINTKKACADRAPGMLPNFTPILPRSHSGRLRTELAGR